MRWFFKFRWLASVHRWKSFFSKWLAVWQREHETAKGRICEEGRVSQRIWSAETETPLSSFRRGKRTTRPDKSGKTPADSRLCCAYSAMRDLVGTEKSGVGPPHSQTGRPKIAWLLRRISGTPRSRSSGASPSHTPLTHWPPLRPSFRLRGLRNAGCGVCAGRRSASSSGRPGRRSRRSAAGGRRRRRES